VKPFEYARPDSLDALLRLLQEHGSDATLLAGGTDVIVRLRKGRRVPKIVIDLKRIEALGPGIDKTASAIRIGARTVITDIVSDPDVRRHFPALIEAALVVGSVQIRNRATLTGNICNASPAADTAPALLVYDASVNVIGGNGGRQIRMTDFFAGPGRTTLGRGEIVESIQLPLPSVRTGSAFARLARRLGVDLAIVSVACAAEATGRVRCAFGAVGPRPFLAQDESGVLLDRRADPSVGEAALRHMFATAEPISDLRASKEYRAAMLPVMTRHALEAALTRLGQVGATKSREPEAESEGQRAEGEGQRAESRGQRAESRGQTVRFVVNGRQCELSVPPHHTLLRVLRDRIGLTGTKECCAEGECGACTILVNGRAVNSCLMLAVEADGDEILTIEGLERKACPNPLQQAFAETGAVQCGFCIPGMIMAASDLLRTNPQPSEAEIKEGLAGNLCRCAAYSQIVKAVQIASKGTDS
jgi:xanthine dehydrogenase iron-sulfur cluster and FAD-binding subunit A